MFKTTFQNIIQFLSSYLEIYTFWDVIKTILDIGIVALLFYALMKLLRDSRAWQIVKGIVIILVVSVVTNLLGLTTLSYIIKIIVNVLPVLLVVIFQPEIRKALETMGNGRLKSFFLGKGKTDSSAEVIDKIVTASFDLGAEKTGALIVMERNTSLGEIIRSGTIVDAEVSVPMLKLLFVPNTPLHDGAVIIRDKQIHAAGCVLPLCARANLRQSLGTRHRAGVGVTENADCVSIIVSEETGKVSFAQNGVITEDVSKEQLTEVLYQDFDVGRESGGIRKIKLKKGETK